MQKITFENLPSTNTPLNASNLNTLQDNVETAINSVVESGSNTNGTYVKFEDGTMICTKTISGTLGGTAWGNIYYSDHTIGSWAQTFTTLYYVNANVVPNQYWCNANGSNFEYVRVFRPNNGTTTGDIRLIAIGKWK